MIYHAAVAGQLTSSLLPFQDLYARFAAKLAQNSIGGGIKVRRRGRATAFIAPLIGAILAY